VEPVAVRQAQFLDLVRELRALGATRVRSGDLEAAFAAAQPVSDTGPGQPERKRVSLSTAELDELEALRSMRSRAEELGVEI